MVLESHPLGPDTFRIVYGCHDSARLFLGGEPLHEDIVSRRNQQVVGSGAQSQCIRLPGPAVGPLHVAPLKVTWINKGSRVPSRLGSEEILCAKVHDAARRDAQTKVGQACFELPHPLPDRIPAAIGHDMDECVGIAGPNQVIVADRPHAHVRIVGAEACGNDNASTGVRRFLGAEHDVLLQDLVFGKNSVTRVEHMDAAKTHGA